MTTRKTDLETETFEDKHGRVITIKTDIDAAQVVAHCGAAYIGAIAWAISCGGLDNQGDDVEVALLTNAYLDKAPGYMHSGIGTEMVRLIAEHTGLQVCVRRHDGLRSNDGSHATQDGPAFNASLVRRELAGWFD